MEEKTLAQQAAQLSPLGARTVFYHQTIADCLGLNPTDHKCLLFLFESRKTMSQLSELTGLSMSAQTAAIGRLEKAGYAYRTHSNDDRRNVYVQIIPENVKKMAELFIPLGESIARLEASYNPNELRLIHEYMQRTADILYEETITLRQNFGRKKRSL